ncbi:centrosome-associated protein CEP250-like isoform X3 [Ornithodoros turicata]|uniref:centrosome-associated protein CEP250-like isoform X3 n=1 Tax=Ornithodoros turicata TaxID=34597 RepID=UPI00313911BA
MDEEEKRIKLEAGKKIFEKKRNKMKRLQIDGSPESGGNGRVMKDSFSENVPPDSLESISRRVEGSNLSDTSQSSTASEKLGMDQPLLPKQTETSIRESMHQYQKMLQSYKEALDQRDRLIEQMKHSLEEAVHSRNEVQKHAERLTKQVADLRQPMQQALLEQKQHVESLRQTVEAQEREIGMLQQIRDDLLGRISAKPTHEYRDIAVGTSPDDKFQAPEEQQPTCHNYQSPVPYIEQYSSTDVPNLKDNGTVDADKLAFCKQTVCSELADWISTRALRVEDYRDVVPILCELKSFAFQGLQYPVVCERLNQTKQQLDILRRDAEDLRENVSRLQAELDASQEELRRLRYANKSLRRGSEKLDEEMKTLKRENSIMKNLNDSLTSIKEKAKQEAEEETTLEVYSLQTECIRLELEKKELEQKTRLLSTGEHSPCVSPVPRPLSPDRTYGHSFTQTELSNGIRQTSHGTELHSQLARLESEKSSLQLIVQQLQAELKQANICADELRREKGAMDSVVAEKNKVVLEKEELVLELQALRERLEDSEAKVKNLQEGLQEEHLSLQKFVSEIEQTTKDVLCGGSKDADSVNIFLEKQRLTCEVKLLNEKLRAECDLSAHLRCQVSHMSKREDFHKKCIKDLFNRLLCTGNEARGLLKRCSRAEQKLEGTLVKVKHLSSEVRRLRQRLSDVEGGLQEDEASHFHEDPIAHSTDIHEDDDSSVFCGVDDEKAGLDVTSDINGRQAMLRTEEQEVLLKNQELGMQVSQELHLCQLRDEMHKNYCNKLSDAMESVAACCQQELLAFEQRLTSETSLQILALEEKHETDIINLKSYHRDQIDKFLSKLQSQPEFPVGRPEKESVLAELRAKQQLEYEQLLSCLDSEQKLRLQALVALTLKVHHVENEVSLLHTQARMNSEKERILELFATANQADKDALVAQLEYEKTSALKRLHEAFLERERELKNTSAPHTPHSVLSDSGSMSWSTGSTNVESLVQLLKDQLDKEFYACIDKLSGKWKEKYSCIINQSGQGGSLVPEDTGGEARDIAANLKKCLSEADEAEQLINAFFHLSRSLKDDFNSKLEQLLHLYQEWSAESKRAAGTETSAVEQSLELEALRTRLEEEYSRQKTHLCAEQVSKTKELLSKHKTELEDVQKFAEEAVAEERRRWLEELDVLRNSFQQKEQENLRQSQEREAKISEEMTELIANYGKILEELGSEKDKVEALQTTLGDITSEYNIILDKIRELIRDPQHPEEAEETMTGAVDRLLGIHSRLLEQSKAQNALFENIKMKLSGHTNVTETSHCDVVTLLESILSENARLKEDLDLMDAEYQTRAKAIEEKFEQVETLRKQKTQELLEAQEALVASLTEKEEQMQLLKNELNVYVGSEGSLRAEHAAEIESLKAELVSHHEKQIDHLKREHTLLMKSAKEEYAASMEKLESSHKEKLEKLIAEHAAEKERLNVNLAASNGDVGRKDEELKGLQSRCAALQCAVEELRAEKQMSKAREGGEVLGSILQGERRGGGEGETSASVPAEIEEKDEDGRVPSLRIQEPSPEWSDVSVEDVLCERTELQRQVKRLGETVRRLETEKEELREQLQKTDEQQTKETRLRARSPSIKYYEILTREWLAGSGLTANEIQSWQLHTAQTNTRLLNVLSDLVKTYVDTEQDIQDTLANLGLSQHPTLDSTAAHEDDYPSLGAISQTHGSKEDFASGIADGFLSELCEDGPDLTPRTWDMFASAIGVQEMESEGEDVVLGASRRLRAAVDRVLRLLTDVAEHRGEDFKGLVQRNQDLCQELQEESNVHNQLCLELLNTQASLRALEQEKQKLEDKLGVMENDYTKLNRELRLAKAKAQRLEDAQESLTEERRLIEEQRHLLTNSLQEPQLTPCTPTDEATSDNKPDNPPEELLEENTKLNEERKRLRKSQDEEKQALQQRIVELEGVLEEASAQRELLFEERQREIADLLAQIEGMDKQLQSNKKFIEEQTHEREQEREDFAQEISRLQETVREKEKIQNCEARLTKEIETLDQQLRFKVEEHALACKKRDQLEAEVRSRDDKIHDLREIIRQLEADLVQKSRSEYELLQKLANMEDALNVEESAHTEAACELERMRRSSVQSDTSDRIKQLEEQLESRNQELDKMTQFQSLLQEFLAQVRALEEKVESRIQQQRSKSCSFRKFLEVLSPEGSRDGAASGQSGTSEETENRRVLSLDDIRDLSPSALQWDELRRLEEKVDTLLTASTEAFKANTHLQKQVKQLERAKGELEQEKFALQEESQRQLLQISAMKARMEDCRAGLGAAGGSPVSQQLYRLKEELLRQKEAREDAEHKLQLSREQFSSLQAKVNMQPHTVAAGGTRGKRSSPATCLFGATVVPLKDPVVKVSTETELSMANLEELEKKVEELRKELEEYRIKCTIQENEIKSLNTYQKKLEKDFEEVQEILEEREDELSAFQNQGDSRAVLEATVGRLQAELTDLHREHARMMEEKAHDSKEQRETLEGQVKMLRDIVEQQAAKHVQAQEALRARIATLEQHLNDCVPREQAESAINRAVSRERDVLKLKHEEELKQQEETWKCLLESDRQKLEEMCFRAQEDMQQKCLSRDRTRCELEAEVQALFEQERAALNAQHSNELDTAQRAHEEEINALRSTHAEEIHCALEELRASLQQIHTEEMEEQKRQLLAAAEHEKQTLLIRHVEDVKCRQQTWEQHAQQQIQSTQPKGWAHGSPKQLQTFVRQHVEQEVKRLQGVHEHEVNSLKAKLKEIEDVHQDDLLKLKQHHSAEVAKARHDAALALKEERQWMNVHAAEVAAAADERLGREKTALLEKMNLERQRLQLDYEQEKTKLIDSHTEQVAAMRAAHKREMDVLRTQLQKLQIKAFTRNALFPDRSHESTPVSDDTSSSELTSSFDDCSQDSGLSPSLRRLLGKIYKDGLQVLSYTERQLLQHHLTPVPGRFDPEGSNEKDFQPDGSSLQRGQSLQEPGELNVSLRKRASEGALVEEVLSLKEQLSRSEWQSKSKFNRLEFQLKQERMKADELKKAMEEEVAKNIELLSQLNGQRSNCLELEMTLASCKADLEEAKSKADCAKKEALYFRNLYETERTRARNMLNAYEAERTHFNQLRASLQTERKRGASTHERDQQTIRELKDMTQKQCLTSQHTSPSMASRDVERMRDADLASLLVGLEGSLPTVTAENEESYKLLHKWHQEKVGLNHSIRKLEDENARLQTLLSNVEHDKNNFIPPATINLLYKVYWKYRRTESWRKALAYQKEYLLSLLRGYQATEETTLKMLGYSSPNPATSLGRRRRSSPLFRFRSAVRVVLAVQRMHHLVGKWKTAAIIPSLPQVLHKAEQVVIGVPVVTASAMGSPGAEAQLYTLAGSTASTNGSSGPLRKQTASSRGSGSQTTENEYVRRLEALHKMFGIDVP